MMFNNPAIVPKVDPTALDDMKKPNSAPEGAMEGFVELFTPAAIAEEFAVLDKPAVAPSPSKHAAKVSEIPSMEALTAPDVAASVAPNVQDVSLQEINDILGVNQLESLKDQPQSNSTTPAPVLPALTLPEERPAPTLFMPTSTAPAPPADPTLTAMAATTADAPIMAADAVAGAPTTTMQPTSTTDAPAPVASDNNSNNDVMITTPMMTNMLQTTTFQPLPVLSRGGKSKEPEIRQFVDTPTNLDVLLGRGGRSNHHVGNKRYRAEVENLQSWYKHSAKSEKKDLSQCLVNYVHSYGGRFLKLDKAAGRWYVIPNNVARRKASQALREHVPMHERIARKNASRATAAA
jgi:hypothetical protein